MFRTRAHTDELVGTVWRDNEAAAEPSSAWDLVLRGLRELTGFDRGVIYDVPIAAAPRRIKVGSVYLHGSPAWQRYLAARRQVDDGELNVLLALRPLPEPERLLAVDWGSSYANTFLYVEPQRPDCDLTDPHNPVRRDLEASAAALLAESRARQDQTAPWTRETMLGRQLRHLFGAWVYWSGTWPWLEGHRVLLRPSGPDETLASRLLPQLPVRFTRVAFERSLAQLLSRESELFHGTVARGRTSFRTRLGLPILHNPRYVDGALRRLVNEGGATLYGYGANGFIRYGREHPVPDSMSDEEFERLMF